MTKISSEKASTIIPKNKVGRPKGSIKPYSEFSRKELRSRYWRIVIPNLQQFKNAAPNELSRLKYQVLDRILTKEKSRSLRYYSIAIQRHLNDIPHLDILLIFAQSVKFKITHFNYILKHGDITTYRKLNNAILDYNKKQDKQVLSNLPEQNSQIIQIQDLKSDPYSYLYDKMKQDPLNFSLQQYVESNQLSKYISGWSSIKTKLKDMQVAAANLLLKNKPGFKVINRQLIEEKLSESQLKIYDSWYGYQTIVDYLNQVPTYGYKRPLKTKNLLITGAPNIGKTSLFHLLYPRSNQNPVSNYVSVYKMGVAGWFPEYQSQVYHMILWNQAKLTAYSYDTILELLEGSAMSLPIKGGFRKKADNPLIIMTSNMNLDQMIKQKFGYNKQYMNMARKNLSVRVQNVIVPVKYNLFLLQKLLINL